MELITLYLAGVPSFTLIALSGEFNPGHIWPSLADSVDREASVLTNNSFLTCQAVAKPSLCLADAVEVLSRLKSLHPLFSFAAHMLGRKESNLRTWT